jgi:hypothetical protein
VELNIWTEYAVFWQAEIIDEPSHLQCHYGIPYYTNYDVSIYSNLRSHVKTNQYTSSKIENDLAKKPIQIYSHYSDDKVYLMSVVECVLRTT